MAKKTHLWQSTTGFSLIAIALIVLGFVFCGQREKHHFLEHGVKRSATVLRKSKDAHLKQSENRYFLHVLLNTNGPRQADVTDGISTSTKIQMTSTDVPVNENHYTATQAGDRVELLVLMNEEPIRARLAEGLASASYQGGYFLATGLTLLGGALVYLGSKQSKKPISF